MNPWVTGVAFLAATVVRTHVIETEGVQPTGGGPRALVQVVTAGGQVRLADVAQLASAEVASFRVRAVRVGSAGMRALVDVLAGEFGVAGESRRALAVEASRGVDAGGPRTAREVSVQTLVDVDAALVLASR